MEHLLASGWVTSHMPGCRVAWITTTFFTLGILVGVLWVGEGWVTSCMLVFMLAGVIQIRLGLGMSSLAGLLCIFWLLAG